MNINTWEDAYNFLEWCVGVSTETLDFAFSICGHNMETANKILDFYTGYRSFMQYIEDMGIEG
jgi:hypothetical protein